MFRLFRLMPAVEFVTVPPAGSNVIVTDPVTGSTGAVIPGGIVLVKPEAEKSKVLVIVVADAPVAKRPSDTAKHSVWKIRCSILTPANSVHSLQSEVTNVSSALAHESSRQSIRKGKPNESHLPVG